MTRLVLNLDFIKLKFRFYALIRQELLVFFQCSLARARIANTYVNDCLLLLLHHHLIIIIIFFYCGTRVHHGSRPPHCCSS